MSHDHSVQGILEKAKAEGELVALTRYGLRHLLRHGYSLAELAPKKKKPRRGGKGGKGKKKDEEEFDMFELPDIGIGSVNDETLIYDEDENDDDD